LLAREYKNKLVCIPQCTEDEDILARLPGEIKRGSKCKIVNDSDYVRLAIGVYQPRRVPYTGDAVEVTGLPLFEFQANDVRFMLENPNCLNANEMGLGKTLETVATFKLLNPTNAIIISPKTVLLHWQEEFEKWAPEWAPYVTVNPTHISFERKKEILIIQYEKLYNGQLLENMKCKLWDLMAVDEAHRIKNASTPRTQKVKTIPCRLRQALTGTPILNRPNDLWSILDWVDERIVGPSYYDFEQTFCRFQENEYGRRPVGLTENAESQELLRQLLATCSVRHLKSDALPGLPKKLPVQTIHLEMDKDQYKLYKNVRDLNFEKLPEKITIPNAAVKNMRLLQVCSNPGMYVDCSNPKFEFVLAMLDENPTRKLLVYSYFKDTVYALRAFLGQHGYDCAVVTGETNDRDHQVKWFTHNDYVQVFAATIGSVQGLDGLQYGCSTEVFFEEPPSPGERDQAVDRLARIGQTEAVTIYDLQCVHSIDQHNREIVEVKAEDLTVISWILCNIPTVHI
jgi:non-specific serine/threonine protein kinase